MIVVDTNVVVYLLLEGDRTKLAQTLFRRDADWRSEAFSLIEFSTVLATYVRTRSLRQATAEQLLGEALRLLRGLSQTPHLGALRLAAQYGVSAYDARFLGVAKRLGTKLVTEDARLRAAAPGLTRSIEEAIAATE